MPRQGRINIEGGLYHVIQRGIECCIIFRDDGDRQEFVNRLAEGLKSTGHKCYGWALMPNHFHLLIRTGVKPLSDLMRSLLTGYALYFNKKYKRSGYLYQNRYKSILCQEDAYMLELVRYIHLNPLRAKLVKNMDELNNYRWCGHSVIVCKSKAPWQSVDEILGLFGSQKTNCIMKYIDFVSEAKGIKREDLTGGGLKRSAGGWSGVFSLRSAGERWQGDERILGDGDFVTETLKSADEKMLQKERLKREGWTLERLADKACEFYGIKKENLNKKGRGNSIAQTKAVIAYLATKDLGLTAEKIAILFTCSRAAISRLVLNGEKIINENDIKLLC